MGLYQYSGFADPELVAAGGILMVIGFAAHHALSRTWLALLLCLYAGAYEVYFIASGTVAAEGKTKSAEVLGSTEAQWQEESVTRARLEYERQRGRFEDSSSREYQSPWFKKNYVDQAWGKYSETQKEQSRYLAGIGVGETFDHVGWLKVFYRLGLAVLVMVLVHRLANLFHHRTTASQDAV